MAILFLKLILDSNRLFNRFSLFMPFYQLLIQR